MGEPEAKKPPAHVLTKPEAPGKIGQGVSARISETIGSTGRVLAAVAGLGVFFFATGYLVEWQRMKHGGLPPEQVIPLIPKEQIAAAGVRELTISIFLGGAILALFVLGLVGLARATENRKGWLARGINRLLEKEVAMIVAIGVFTLLLVPFGVLGVVVAIIVTGLFFYGLRLVRRFLAAGGEAKFPLWRLTLAVALAAVAMIAIRQHEFPEPRSKAIAVLTDGTEFKVAYVASDSDKILLRRQHKDRPTELIVVQRDDLESLRVIKSKYVFSLKPSLLDEIAGLVEPDFQLSCIPPECRWDESTRIGPSSLF